jgi:PAS domain S-box-containing protein
VDLKMPVHPLSRVRKKAFRTIGAPLLLPLCLLIPEFASAQPKPVRNVLILNEDNPDYPAIRLIDTAIQKVLENSPYHVELFPEYMDTIHFPAPAVQQQFRDYFIQKYLHRQPDVIITVGPSPLAFMAEIHRADFPGVPIVFCLTNGPMANPELDSDFTGVEEDMAPAETVAAALRLLPATKHLVVVGGTSAFDRQEQAAVKEQVVGFQNRLDISYLTDLAMPAILERLRQLPDDTVVLLTTIAQDATGERFTSNETGPLIASASNAPVFSLFSVYLNHGEVGGDVSDISQQGVVAGEMALKILKGAKPQDLLIAKDVTSFEFDWRALRRWKLSASNLPPGSIILDRPPSAWETYSRYVIGGIALILIEALLISALLWQRLRRRKTERELSLAYDRLRLALEAARSVGWDWDLKSGRDHWFGDLQTVFGIPSTSYWGKVEDFRRRVHPQDSELMWKAIAEARQTRKPYVVLFRLVRQDQSVCWLSARGRFYYSKTGEAERMLGIAVDISDRMLANEKLRESEERFRLVANTAPVMIWMSGTDMLCNYFNQPWLDFTGRPIESELNDGWADAVHPQDLEGCLKTYREAFEKRATFKMEYRLRRRDGQFRWMFDTGVPRFNPDGSFAGYIGSCIDVTDQKAAEESLASVGRRLIEAHEEERTRIARELHDDITQDIALAAGELGRWAEQAPSTGLFYPIHHVRDRLEEIANDVQALSHRLHSSKLEYLGIVAAAQGFCREVSEQKNVTVDFSESGVPKTLPREASLCLFRVLQEALLNAVKYSGVRRFQVDLSGTPEQVSLTIRDSGRGFELREAVTHKGLGLISMRERAQLVGGELMIQSEVGHGTTVSVHIPLAVHSVASG